MSAIKQANSELLAEFAAKDPKTKEILESINTYQAQSRAWTDFSERAFLENSESE